MLSSLRGWVQNSCRFRGFPGYNFETPQDVLDIESRYFRVSCRAWEGEGIELERVKIKGDTVWVMDPVSNEWTPNHHISNAEQARIIRDVTFQCQSDHDDMFV